MRLFDFLATDPYQKAINYSMAANAPQWSIAFAQLDGKLLRVDPYVSVANGLSTNRNIRHLTVRAVLW